MKITDSKISGILPDIISWILIAFGICFLTWSAWSAAYCPNMDYAVVVEMARNMAAGKDFPVFFYGQAYMGSFEPAVSALLCALFGPDPFNICMGTALFGILALFIVRYVGRILGGKWGSVFSLLFTISGGHTLIYCLVSPRGGYGLATVLVILALTICSISKLTDDADEKVALFPIASFGFLAGLALWNVWIAFPAFAAASILIVCKLKWKVFSLRFLATSLTAFFTGSSPWWIWTFKNGLGALDIGNGGTCAIGWKAITQIFTIVLSDFFETSGSAGEFYKTPLPWILAVIFVISIISILKFGNRKLLSYLAALTVYLLVFSIVYSQTHFGAGRAPRYLVPSIPLFAILCGSALGCVIQHVDSFKRPWSRNTVITASAAFSVIFVLCVTIPVLRVTKNNMEKLQEEGRQWAKNMNSIVNDPAMKEAAFADFAYFGGNWVTDRRICVVSATRWRYRPYLLALEKAAHPSVLNNQYAFNSFCDASGGSYRNRRIGQILLTDNIRPPVYVEEIQPSVISNISLANYKENIASLLQDDNLSTHVWVRSAKDKSPFIDIVFNNPVITAGISALIDDIHCARGWKAELFDQDDTPISATRDDPHQGWFWSGPRQYQFGPDCRWTMRWSPVSASRIRLTFTPRKPGAPILIPDMRILSDIPVPDSELSDIESSVSQLLLKHPGSAIHAGRWLGNQLGAQEDPSLTFGQFGGDLLNKEVCKFATIDLNQDNIVIIHGKSAADSSAATLTDIGCQFERTETGGYSVFFIPQRQLSLSHELQTFYSNGRIRFFGGRVMRETNMENDEGNACTASADFGPYIHLKGFSFLPEEIKAGQEISLNVNWLISDEIPAKERYSVYIHGEQNGKLVFQDHAYLRHIQRPIDIPRTTTTSFKISTPMNLDSEDIIIYICVKKEQMLSKRFKISNASLPRNNSRLQLGNIIISNSK